MTSICLVEATSCFPDTNPVNGTLELNERKETLPGLLAYPICILGSILLYPAVFAIALVAEIYLGINLLYNKYKINILNKKIEAIKTYSEQEMETIKSQRLKKLETREPLQLKEAAKAITTASRYDDKLSIRKRIEIIKHMYVKAKENAIAKDQSMEAVFQEVYLKKKVKVIRALESTLLEKALYKDSSSERSRETLSSKYEFAKLRREVNQHVDLHYLKVLLITQIPVIGLLFAMHIKSTTKTSLEKTDLVERYNKTIQDDPWLKPYSRIFD